MKDYPQLEKVRCTSKGGKITPNQLNVRFLISRNYNRIPSAMNATTDIANVIKSLKCFVLTSL